MLVSPASRMLITLKFIWPISMGAPGGAFISAGQVPSHAMIFVVLRVDVVIVLAKHVRVLHIGCGTFQAVQAQQAQAENVLANRGFVFVRGKFCGLTL